MNFFGQALAVAALHQCQDKNHAELLVQLTRDLIKAKESVSKDTASPIIKSEWEEIDEKDIIGFRVNQVVNSNGIKTPTQSQLVRRGSFVCEITLVQIQTPKEELLGLAKEILTIALSQSETIEEK